jgi:prepilin-type N-terminal cleavage/methylation domain-containing protein
MRHSDDGFTLIELLVVMLVIAILLAIAIPTFLSTIGAAYSTSTKSLMGSAVEAVNSAYTANEGTFVNPGYSTLAAQLNATDPGPIKYVNPGVNLTPGSNQVEVRTSQLPPWNSSAVELVAYSKNDACLFAIVAKYPQPGSSIYPIAQGGTWYDVVLNAPNCSTSVTPNMNNWTQSMPSF